MLSIIQGLNKRGRAGEPLPTVFKSLADMGAHFRRGQLHLIAAAPGIGKSAFTANLIFKAGVPTFYFSADSDAFTQYVRVGAIATGFTTTEVEQLIADGNTQALNATLAQHNHIRWNFNAAPTIDDLEEELQAYADLYGWPHCIVIDNVSNVVHEDGADGYAGLEKLTEYFHELARTTGAAVIGLHHVTGPWNNGIEPVPLSGIRGQIGRVPEVILTLHKGGNEFEGLKLNVSICKNRGGKADPSGSTYAELTWEPDRMAIAG
ncbi:AAA family ATPase [Streptomyces sp. 769]|uniref:AAA family ATPase n=1 Tax=Streptomyces sp. 769 TaxID=1262452 RepID=UPI00057D005C|nr:AAA family ATPase [Streptomyces sp. 769]AJC53975.1 gp71 [Streptomyces sp. 769]